MHCYAFKAHLIHVVTNNLLQITKESKILRKVIISEQLFDSMNLYRVAVTKET